MTIPKEMLSGKVFDKTVGYVYLARIDIGKSFIYKIGYTRNIKKRYFALRAEWGWVIDILAYGCCKNPKDVEFEMQDAFYPRCHFHFVYEMLYPKWSIEYFKFDYDDIVKVIDMMFEKCFCTIISKHFKMDTSIGKCLRR